MTNFQLLVLSPNLLKSNKHFTRGFAENCLKFLGKKMPGMPGQGVAPLTGQVVCLDKKGVPPCRQGVPPRQESE